MKIFITYLFEIYVTASYIYVAFISRTMNRDRFNLRIILSIIALIMGFVLDYFQFPNGPNRLYLILGAAPIIYIIYYVLLNILLVNWLGKYPYSPYWDKIGDKIKGNGYPKNRFVRNRDYVYGIFLMIIPIITLAIISMITT